MPRGRGNRIGTEKWWIWKWVWEGEENGREKSKGVVRRGGVQVKRERGEEKRGTCEMGLAGWPNRGRVVLWRRC